MPEQTSISIVIPFRDAAVHIAPIMDSLFSNGNVGLDVEVIAVDNGSNDETLECLRSYKASLAPNWQTRLSILEERSTLSSYAARNCGIMHSRGQIVAFTDADCRPNADWLEALCLPFREESIGIVAGEIMGETGSSLAEKYALRRGLLNQRFTLNHPFRPYGQTANLAVRRQVFWDVGLFRRFMTSGGDADFCWRALEAGWKLTFAPHALVKHIHRATLPGLLSQFRRYGGGNRMLSELYGLNTGPNLALSKSVPFAVALVKSCYYRSPGDMRRAVLHRDASIILDSIISLMCRRQMAIGWSSFRESEDMNTIDVLPEFFLDG